MNTTTNDEKLQELTPEQAHDEALLINQLIEVRNTRQRLTALQAERRTLEEAFREDHKDLFDGEAATRAILTEQEASVKASILDAHETTGSKAPAPGAGIRVATSYEYDAAAALTWALEHKMALALDRGAFGQICKADATRPDFVVVVQAPSATIATDLDKALAGVLPLVRVED